MHQCKRDGLVSLSTVGGRKSLFFVESTSVHTSSGVWVKGYHQGKYKDEESGNDCKKRIPEQSELVALIIQIRKFADHM